MRMYVREHFSYRYQKYLEIEDEAEEVKIRKYNKWIYCLFANFTRLCKSITYIYQ